MADIASTRGMTPNQLAHKYGIGVHKVLTWINRGELLAINVAASQSGRPQWSILPEAIQAFEKRRAAGPKVEAPRRRRTKQNEVIRFF